jgi:hypothetical protein
VASDVLYSVLPRPTATSVGRTRMTPHPHRCRNVRAHREHAHFACVFHRYLRARHRRPTPLLVVRWRKQCSCEVGVLSCPAGVPGTRVWRGGSPLAACGVKEKRQLLLPAASCLCGRGKAPSQVTQCIRSGQGGARHLVAGSPAQLCGRATVAAAGRTVAQAFPCAHFRSRRRRSLPALLVSVRIRMVDSAPLPIPHRH